MAQVETSPKMTLTVDGHVAELTLNSPETQNAFDAEAHERFAGAIETLRHAEDVRAVVLASTGDDFSAGGNLDFMLRAHDDPAFLLRSVEEGRAMLAGLLDLAVPVIAAVQGPAIGLGATVAFACDMVVAARPAFFADPHVRIGLAAGDGGCLVWPQAVGSMRARRYLLTGDRLSAEDAYQFGLVTDLVEQPGDALPAARQLAAKVASFAPLAVRGTKRALANLTRARAVEVVDLALSYEVRCAVSDDLVEAITSRQQGRPAVFSGR